MSAPRFGTDGLRGVAGAELTPELALALGRAAAQVLGGGRWYLGRDTRRSGGLLQGALAAGLAAEGADVVDAGVAPTPAIAFACQRDGAAGAVVSASHNPFADNGIKLFAPGGRKLVDEVERAIEALLPSPPATARAGADLGTTAEDGSVVAAWADHVAGSIEGRRLSGLQVVVDTANGAAVGVAPHLLAELGCDVLAVLGGEPDGRNINDGCGSTHLGLLAASVAATGADVGVAFDGDADRCLMVDHRGEVVDGDQLMAVLALDRRDRGVLPASTLVVTVMSNLGLRLAMERHGIALETTAVGDRYVLDRMEDGGFALGGEQSGHVILRDLATTGDGLLTAVQVLDVVARRRAPLAEVAGVVRRLPQVLLNVPVAGAAREALAGAAAVHEEVAAVEAELAGQGRVLLRPSGTEPVVRVMVEAPTDAAATAAAERIAAAVRSALG